VEENHENLGEKRECPDRDSNGTLFQIKPCLCRYTSNGVHEDMVEKIKCAVARANTMRNRIVRGFIL
jgi:hypothetical protein